VNNPERPTPQPSPDHRREVIADEPQEVTEAEAREFLTALRDAPTTVPRVREIATWLHGYLEGAESALPDYRRQVIADGQPIGCYFPIEDPVPTVGITPGAPMSAHDGVAVGPVPLQVEVVLNVDGRELGRAIGRAQRIYDLRNGGRR